MLTQPLVVMPGSPASFDVQTYTAPNLDPSMVKVWRFYNAKGPADSLINNIEVKKNGTGLSGVEMNFQVEGCDSVKAAFSHLGADFHCFLHKHNFCQMEIYGKEKSLKLLEIIKRSSTFSPEASLEMDAILEEINRAAKL